jgi:hypothetical protein
MKSLRSSAVAIVSTVAFGTAALSVASAAHADDTDTDTASCTTRQAQVDRATVKLTALTARFAAHPTKHNQKAKRAQVQRVTHATARLATCTPGTTDDSPEDTTEVDD